MKLGSTAIASLVIAAGIGAVQAQTVTLNGHIGAAKALLVIDGEPHTVAVGSTVRGVRLLSLTEAQAEVEVNATRRTLALGAGPVRVTAGTAQGGTAIVLTAGTNGHFRTTGQINGKSIEFMVDTGASSVVISQADADRLGIDTKSAPVGMAETANGRAPYRLVVLSSVRVGDVEIANVEAAVIPAQMRGALLGNSFLQRFQMRRDNDTMRLEKRN
jgi:aspartyl protease family protein